MNRIKEVLDEKGIKQTWLAEKLGKSYNMVNGYVQNRQQPRLEVLNEIAEILDIDIKELIVLYQWSGQLQYDCLYNIYLIFLLGYAESILFVLVRLC